MSYEPIVRYALWIVPSLLQVFIAVLMLRRGLHRGFPIFFAYTLSHVLRFVVFVSIIHQPYAAYFYTYWTFEIIDGALSFGVIYELFRYVFLGVRKLQEWSVLFLQAASLVLLLVVIVTVSYATGPDSSRLIRGILLFSRSIMFLQCGLLVAITFLSSLFPLRWSTHTFGIALGFALQSSVSLGTLTARAYLGPSADFATTLVNSLGYGCGVIAWFVYLRMREAEVFSAHVERASIWEMRRWNQALLQLIKK